MKKRLDVLLSEQNPEMTRSRAQAVIMSGKVYVNGQKELKAGAMFPEDAAVEIRGEALRYVSRGGLKLERAIERFGVELGGVTAMDVGASTGGFTDCMLQNGAQKVYAVDVGTGQLNEKLLADPRVINLENTNARYIDDTVIPEKVDFVSIDVSFISLRLILPAVVGRIKESGNAVCLIKPQFEAGRENLNKHGVVKDKKVHIEVIETVCDFVKSLGWQVIGLDYSPVKGPEGNIEYLLRIAPQGTSLPCAAEISPPKTVEAAHTALDTAEK